MKLKSLQLALPILLAACAQLPEKSPQPNTVASKGFSIYKKFVLAVLTFLLIALAGCGPQSISKDDTLLQPTAISYPYEKLLGVLPNLDHTDSVAMAVSDDGKTVVGYSYSNYDTRKAFVWTSQEGMKDISVPGSTFSTGYDVSGNGNVVAVYSSEGQYLWSKSTGFQRLPNDFEFIEINVDGTKLLGLLDDGDIGTNDKPYVLSLTSGARTFFQDVTSPSCDELGVGYGRSIHWGDFTMDDSGSVVLGSVRAGRCYLDENYRTVVVPGLYKWINGTPSFVADYPGAGFTLNADGSVYTTTKSVTIGYEKYTRVSRNGQVLDPISGLEDADYYPWSISGDGKVILGRADRENFGSYGFIWSSTDGTSRSPFGGITSDLDFDGGVVVGSLRVDGSSNTAARVYVATVWSTTPIEDLKKSQTITFTSTPPSSATVGSAYTVRATASSGLAVSFSSVTPDVCNVSNSTVSFVAAGTCTVSASQAGNASYNAAPTVSQDITVTADPETPTTDPETPTTSTYTIGFENAPTDRILRSLRVGQDITGPATSGRIAVSGKRIIRGKYRGGNYAKVVDLYGSKRLIVAASKSGTTPNPRGGRMQFAFNAGAGFGSGSVTVNTITLSNVTADGASVDLYRGRTLIRKVDVPVTGAGESVTLTIDEPGVTIVSALARFPMAVDNLVVSQ